MPDKPSHYRCPICKSVSCETVGYLLLPKADGKTIALYACATCTNVFVDPLALTRGYEDRPRTSNQNPSGRSYTEWSLINTARKDRKA